MELFWKIYFLIGMSYTLGCMAELSWIGSISDIIRFMYPEEFEDEEKPFREKFVSLFVLLTLIIMLVLGWPFFYFWYRKK